MTGSYITAETINAETVTANKIRVSHEYIEVFGFLAKPKSIVWPTGFAGTPGAALPPRPSWDDWQRFEVSPMIREYEELVARRRKDLKKDAQAGLASASLLVLGSALLVLTGVFVVGGFIRLASPETGFSASVALLLVGLGVFGSLAPSRQDYLRELLEDEKQRLDAVRDRNVTRLERELDREINWDLKRRQDVHRDQNVG